MMEWHKLSEEKPKKLMGEYLVARYITELKDPIYQIAIWTKNLRSTEVMEFDSKEYERSGFYTYMDDMRAYEIVPEAWVEIERYKK